YWDYTRDNVFVMERIHGIPIANVAALKAAGTNMRVLAERGVETFFTQVFVHNFFHADMHPGNIFVDVTNPESPRYIAIDCAIIGSLTPDDQNYLARNLLAFFNQDYQQVARLHLESGWIPEGTRIDEFETVIRQVCEPIFAKPLRDISFGHFLVTLFQTARQFNMEVQPQLVLLQKTLLAIEGLGRQLYPELDLWTTAKPVLEQWMRERRDPRTQLKRLIEAWPEITEDLSLLPRLLHRAIRRADAADADERRASLTVVTPPATRSPRLERAIAGAALLIAGVVWSGLSEPQWIGWLASAAGLLLLVLGRRERTS
ncbi:MAG TPA: AarF/UbiB family protein, partial [Gammaproteobacteria bacterium]|nr:AarF/UbiB family protein [Gammaproteobacteria bacterium]